MTFFGLQVESKIQIHESVFALCLFGRGGFTHSEVYNMPIYLRNFYTKKLEEVIHKEAEAQNKALKSNDKPTRPSFKR